MFIGNLILYVVLVKRAKFLRFWRPFYKALVGLT